MKIELKATRRNCSICEKEDRYDIIVDGKIVDQLYFNLKGYCGAIPFDDRKITLGEAPISKWKKLIKELNREFRNG
jgi:hypothetical protein